jgi:hypothetical protein
MEADAKHTKIEAIVVDGSGGTGERFVSLGEFNIDIEPDVDVFCFQFFNELMDSHRR